MKDPFTLKAKCCSLLCPYNLSQTYNIAFNRHRHRSSLLFFLYCLQAQSSTSNLINLRVILLIRQTKSHPAKLLDSILECPPESLARNATLQVTCYGFNTWMRSLSGLSEQTTKMVSALRKGAETGYPNLQGDLKTTSFDHWSQFLNCKIPKLVSRRYLESLLCSQG